MANTLTNWNGTFKFCPCDLRKRDTATVNFERVNQGNMFVGIEGVIPDLFLEGPMTKFQMLKIALDHANQHVQNMTYTHVDTRHCYGCIHAIEEAEKVKREAEKVKSEKLERYFKATTS
jgi:hypothetical protein